MRKSANRGDKIRGRLARLNVRLGQIRKFNEPDHDGKPDTHITYTAAKKALKAIPRAVREGYEKSLRQVSAKQVDDVERQRKALRATEIPSERVASKKAERETRKQKRNG